MSDIKTLKDFEQTLVQRVQAGIAHVIGIQEYKSLPAELKRRYYPLYRRSDTTYRMYPKYMRTRRDRDPITEKHTMVRARPATWPTLFAKSYKPTEQASTNINTSVTQTNTALSRKTMAQIRSERRFLQRNPTGVTTKFS